MGNRAKFSSTEKITIIGIKGFTKLTLKGTGVLFSSDLEPIKRAWEVQEITQIVRKIANELGFDSPDIQEPEEMVFDFFQQYESNARFLTRLANIVGYSFWVDNNFHWKAREAKGASSITLVYKGTTDEMYPGYILGDPSIEFSFTRSAPAQVSATSVQDKTKVAGPGGKSPSAVKVVTGKNGPRLVMDDYGTIRYSSKLEEKGATFAEKKKVEAKHTEKVYTPSGKPAKAAGVWRSKKDVSKFEIKIIGLASLGVGNVVTVANCGKINEGKWYVRKIKHSITKDGFTMNLTLSRSSGKTAQKAVTGKVNQSKDTTTQKSSATVRNGDGIDKKIIMSDPGNLIVISRRNPTLPDSFRDKK